MGGLRRRGTGKFETGRSIKTQTPSLFGCENAYGGFAPPRFDGATYSPALDRVRLGEQSQGVFNLMKDGQWRTLVEIGVHVEGSLTGLSARLRDFRKRKFGGHTVERRRRGEPGDGVFEYRLIVNHK